MSTIGKLRGPKIADMAIFDWAATGIVAAVIGGVVGNASAGILIFIILILIAVITHFVLGIPTMLNVYLGLACKKDVYATRAT
jgi:uncharacterized membrane protein YcaP (DUF421 family)